MINRPTFNRKVFFDIFSIFINKNFNSHIFKKSVSEAFRRWF